MWLHYLINRRFYTWLVLACLLFVHPLYWNGVLVSDMPAFKTAFRKSYLFEIARNIYVHSKAFTENKNNKIYLYITHLKIIYNHSVHMLQSTLSDTWIKYSHNRIKTWLLTHNHYSEIFRRSQYFLFSLTFFIKYRFIPPHTADWY